MTAADITQADKTLADLHALCDQALQPLGYQHAQSVTVDGETISLTAAWNKQAARFTFPVKLIEGSVEALTDYLLAQKGVTIDGASKSIDVRDIPAH